MPSSVCSVLLLPVFTLHFVCLRAFVPNVAHLQVKRRIFEIPWLSVDRRALFSSRASGDNNSSNLDDLRRALEAAWNVETMGYIPTSALGAAKAAVTSLNTALERQHETDSTSIFMIDILLPHYDITAGTNLYDEVLAVEFCIALANLVSKGKSEILVRDSKVLQTVNRIFEAREKTTSVPISTATKEMPAKPETKPDPPTIEETDLSDDFAELGVTGETATSSNTTDNRDTPDDSPFLLTVSDNDDSTENKASIDSFRQMLLLSWEATVDLDVIPADELISEVNEPVDDSILESVDVVNGIDKRYRLASFLGDANISRGSDMIDDVVAAVKTNALPSEDEETIIILSPMTKEELCAVRAIVGKYKNSKTIILVNCKLDPLPQELLRAQTVYSILPLIARRTGRSNTDPAPKVVVLRRFPSDWEVYVDTGNGFDLAASVPATTTETRRGLPMEWISSAVKRYLQQRALNM